MRRPDDAESAAPPILRIPLVTLTAQRSVTADRPEKIARLARVLDARGATALRLTSHASLAWLLDGARTAVPTGGPPVFSARVDRRGEIVVTAPRNEADRLASEELGGCEVDVVDWFRPLVARAGDELAESDVEADLRAARAALLPAERASYRALGRDAATAMTQVLSAAVPTDTEHVVAARASAALRERGIEPSVCLVAGASRGHVPHPLPTAAVIGPLALAVITGVRDGLHLSLSRWVRFSSGATPTAIYDVEADVWDATRPGRTLGDVVSDAASSYARHGFDAAGTAGWLRHHQGGPAGYAGRDPKARPDSTDRVVSGQAFAWNPWAPGAKLEDTIVVDGPGSIEILSADPAWPVINVAGQPRPDILDRS